MVGVGGLRPDGAAEAEDPDAMTAPRVPLLVKVTDFDRIVAEVIAMARSGGLAAEMRVRAALEELVGSAERAATARLRLGALRSEQLHRKAASLQRRKAALTQAELQRCFAEREKSQAACQAAEAEMQRCLAECEKAQAAREIAEAAGRALEAEASERERRLVEAETELVVRRQELEARAAALAADEAKMLAWEERLATHDRGLVAQPLPSCLPAAQSAMLEQPSTDVSGLSASAEQADEFADVVAGRRRRLTARKRCSTPLETGMVGTADGDAGILERSAAPLAKEEPMTTKRRAMDALGLGASLARLRGLLDVQRVGTGHA